MQLTAIESKAAIEAEYGCEATFAYTVPVRELRGNDLIEASVHVFTLSGHPDATEAYCCPPSPVGSKQRGLVIVLRQGLVDSPLMAMRSVLGLL